jgi:ketosteroid isomerase-like protein
MAESENVQVARQGYENFRSGSISSLLDQMAEDVVWQLPDIEGVPLGGTRTGRAGVADFFSTLARDQEVIEFEPREFIAQDDKVVSLGHYKWRVRETGREFESDFVHVFTVRDGKIAAFREHFDTAAYQAAYQK